MLAALTLFSCGYSGSSPEGVLLPHRSQNYVFNFSPLTYTCNENAEVGVGPGLSLSGLQVSNTGDIFETFSWRRHLWVNRGRDLDVPKKGKLDCRI